MVKFMAFASKSAAATRRRRVASRKTAVSALNPGVIPLPLKAKGKPSRETNGRTVPIFRNSQSAPLWLLYLCGLQRRCSVVMLVLMASMLSVYGWTVYSQRMWSQAYRKLETLQRNERQLTTANEVLKNHIALQAEQPNTELMPPTSAALIFLQPPPQLPAVAANPVLPATKPGAQKQPIPMPLGY